MNNIAFCPCTFGIYAVNVKSLEKGIEEILIVSNSWEREKTKFKRNSLLSQFKKYKTANELVESEAASSIIHESIHIVLYRFFGELVSRSFDYIDERHNISSIQSSTPKVKIDG